MAGFLAAPRVGAGPATPGDQLWVRRYNGPGNQFDVAYALGVSPDGSKVFVTGASAGSTSDDDYATVAYDASTGDGLWVSRYKGPLGGDDVPSALGVSPDGSTVFVTGSSGNDYATLALDAVTGARLWVSLYNGPGNSSDGAYALGLSPDGSTVFVTGYSFSSTSSYDYATVAYDASNGAQLWAMSYNGPANRDDVASALGVSADGSKVFVTGRSRRTSPNSYDYATVAYDASTGAQLWVRRYNGPGNGSDGASALGVSPEGFTVFVTGGSVGSTRGSDYATVAYDAATGVRLWTRRYNGPGSSFDVAYALGVSPDASEVFVTGASLGSSSYDYATVAYSIT